MKLFDIKKINTQNDYVRLAISSSVLIFLIIVFTLIEPRFLNFNNIRNLLSDSAPIMVMGIGMTMIILLGSIDLSVGTSCAVANVLIIKYLSEIYADTNNMLLAVIGGYSIPLIFGIMSGFIMGTIHTKFKIPSFITSLAFMSIWKSLALNITNSSVAAPRVLWSALDWFRISFGIIGVPLIISVFIAVLFYILHTRTSFGKSVSAIGYNENAARMAGINTHFIKIVVFTFGGICASLGGIFLAAKLKSSAPTVGDSMPLLVIASVVLGGTALTGGRGNVLGTIIGVLIVATVRNGMNMTGIDVFWQNIIFGVIMLLAISLSFDRGTRNIVVK